MSEQHCGRGPCAAMEGHEGSCAEASGWDDEPSVDLLRALAGAVDAARAARRVRGVPPDGRESREAGA